jgi:TRAP-type C4-dicarboxylate transport system substrate-binding protein
MKTKKRYSLVLISMILAVSVVVSGCGNSSDTPDTTKAAAEGAKKSEGASQAGSDEVVKITFAHFFPATHPVHIRWAEWADAISKATDGKVKITFYYAQTLLSASETYEGVVSGIADMGIMYPGYTPGLFPMLELFDLPVDYNNCEVISKVFWDCYNEFQPEELSKVKVLSIYAIGPGGIATKKPVETLDDLSGMQIRAVGLSSGYMSALGAVPVSLPMPESYEAVSRGVCDGVLNAWDAFVTWKTVEVADYFTMTPFLYTGSFITVMNLDTWNSLPADVQAAFEQVSKEFISYHASSEAKNALYSAQKILDSGKKIIVLSDEEEARWLEAVQPAIAKAIADRADKGPAQEFYNRMVELAEKYNAEYPSLKDAYLEMIKK